MKRILAVVFTAMLLLTAVLPSALAAEPNPIPVIAKKDLSPTPKGIHHFMLICIDSWATKLNVWGNHTDGLILVTIDEYAHRIMLTSFIRDMLIQRPDGKFGRINNFLDSNGWTAQNHKTSLEGLQALVDTINTHFDLQIEKYFVMDFKQVENIINAVGGVDISITSREANYLRNYSISSASTQPVLGGAGTYHFSGHAAVIYMRIRKIRTEEYLHADGKVYADTQDYGRTYRDRKVLSSIAESLKDVTYEDAMKLLDVIISNTIYTNMTTDEMLAAVDLAMEMRGVPVEHIRMPVEGTFEEFPYSSMATKQIDFIANREALHDFMLNSFVVVDEE